MVKEKDSEFHFGHVEFMISTEYTVHDVWKKVGDVRLEVRLELEAK